MKKYKRSIWISFLWAILILLIQNIACYFTGQYLFCLPFIILFGLGFFGGNVLLHAILIFLSYWLFSLFIYLIIKSLHSKKDSEEINLIYLLLVAIIYKRA